MKNTFDGNACDRHTRQNEMKRNENDKEPALACMRMARKKIKQASQQASSRSSSNITKNTTVKQNRNMEWIRRSNRENSSTHLSNLFGILYYIATYTRAHTHECTRENRSFESRMVYQQPTTSHPCFNLWMKKLFREEERRQLNRNLFFCFFVFFILCVRCTPSS